MTKSFIVDPKTGKLLTAQEWKETAGENVASAKIVAIVPDDGSPAFAFPVETFGDHPWPEAMDIADKYQAPHAIAGANGSFTLPTRKQAIDIRAAREAGLEQLLEMIGAQDLLDELRHRWGWTCEKYIPGGTSEDRWSCVRYSSGDAWSYSSGGVSDGSGFTYGLTVRVGFAGGLTVRPVTLLNLNS